MRLDSDLLAGILFMVFGLGTVALGWGYGMGSMNAPGSGAMPVAAGGALAALGLVQLLRTLAVASRAPRSRPAAFKRAELRPLLVILAAVVAFAALILPAGLIPALVALIAIAWFAQDGGARWELFGAMALVIVVIIAIFKLGLGLPLRLVVGVF